MRGMKKARYLEKECFILSPGFIANELCDLEQPHRLFWILNMREKDFISSAVLNKYVCIGLGNRNCFLIF